MRIGLVQIVYSGSWGYHFPHAAGLLQAYAQKYLRHPERCEFLPLIYQRPSTEEALKKLGDVDVAGFSLYTWNAGQSLKIARELKRARPGVLIVFGGPQVPDRSEPFLRDYPFIDIACNGEGERVFLQILEHAQDRDWRDIPSVAYLDAGGRFVQHPKAQRISDLDSLPSPYLEGVYDPLLAQDVRWSGILETNRGCPFSCSFCDWGSAVASKIYSRSLDNIYKELEWFAQRRIEKVDNIDANFGIFPRDVEIAKYCAGLKERSGYPKIFTVHDAKNVPARTLEIEKILADAGLAWRMYSSLQSLDPAALKNVKRDNIRLDVYHELQQRAAAQGIDTLTDLILGLPGETYESFTRGVAEVMERGQHGLVNFTPLVILPNAEVGDPEYRRKFGMLTVKNKRWQSSDSNLPEDEVFTEEFVIATDSMPKPDWVRTRAFCWMADLLHYEKTLQVPFVLLREVRGIPYLELLRLFFDGAYEQLPPTSLDAPGEGFPILSRTRSFFLEKAKDIQEGGFLNCRTERWPYYFCLPNEHVLIQLYLDGRIGDFYRETERALQRLLQSKGVQAPDPVLRDAVALSQGLVRMPNQGQDLDVEVGYNLWEFYKSVLSGRKIPLQNRPLTYRILRSRDVLPSWDAWLEKVKTNRFQKGQLFHWNGCKPVEPAQVAVS